MKITKQQLKEIIKEEIEAVMTEGIKVGSAGFRGKVKDFLPKSMAHAVGNVSKGLAGNPKYIAAWKAIGKELNSGNIETFIRKVKMSDDWRAPLTPNAEEYIARLLKSMEWNKLKAVHSLKDVVSLMGPEGRRRGHAIGSPRDPGYVRANESTANVETTPKAPHDPDEEETPLELGKDGPPSRKKIDRQRQKLKNWRTRAAAPEKKVK